MADPINYNSEYLCILTDTKILIFDQNDLNTPIKEIELPKSNPVAFGMYCVEESGPVS